MPQCVAFPPSPQAWNVWKQGLLLSPSKAEQGTHSSPAALGPSGFFTPMFVLAESCSGLFEAESVKARESGHGITEEGAGRGLRRGIRGGRAVG